MKVLVTGGAGCIGSELVGELLSRGHQVECLDNLSSGKMEHINRFLDDKNFSFINGDILNPADIDKCAKNVEVVFHLAANPDIKYRDGDRTDKDLQQNTLGTYNVLEAMRKNNVKKIVFSSSSAVYGEAQRTPTTEDYGPLMPESLYGASKLACEGLISSYCHMFGFQAWIFRFANIVGGKSRKTGTTVISDFISKLRSNPHELTILGNGRQSKSYLIVEECVSGILFGLENAHDIINIYNLSPGDSVSVDEIANVVIKEMNLSNVEKKYSGSERGWPGDVPKVVLDSNRMDKLGWKSKYTSKNAIVIATRALINAA
jgi:UDP-glucose 4-epimerase